MSPSTFSTEKNLNTMSYLPSRETTSTHKFDSDILYNYWDNIDYSYDELNEVNDKDDSWNGPSDWVQHWIDK